MAVFGYSGNMEISRYADRGYTGISVDIIDGRSQVDVNISTG